MEIQTNIKKGIRTITCENVLNLDETKTKQKIRELFEPLVKDQQLLDLLTLEENIQKIKTRLEYQIKPIGEKDEQLGELITVGTKTPREVITELKQHFTPGMTFEQFYDQIKYVLTKKGYSYKPNQKGNLKNMKMQITFRKA